jgi:hypothetical protein
MRNKHRVYIAKTTTFNFLKSLIKTAFAMKIWEKGKKDHRRQDDRETTQQDFNKKKKMKPVEKTKYRIKDHLDDMED